MCRKVCAPSHSLPPTTAAHRPHGACSHVTSLPYTRLCMCVQSCDILSHMQFCVTMSTIKTRNCPVTTGLPPAALHSTKPLATTTLLPITTVLIFHECYINGIKGYVAFWKWLFPLTYLSWSPRRLLHCHIVHIFCFLRSIDSVAVPWFVSPLTHWTFGLQFSLFFFLKKKHLSVHSINIYGVAPFIWFYSKYWWHSNKEEKENPVNKGW